MRKAVISLSASALGLLVIWLIVLVAALLAPGTAVTQILTLLGLYCISGLERPAMLVVLGLTLVMAARARDWLALALILLGALMAIGGPHYAAYATSRIQAVPCGSAYGSPPSSCAPNRVASVLAGYFAAQFVLPLLTLLYALLEQHRTLQRSAMGALAAVAVAIPLAAAPPWTILNPPAVAPVMLVSQPAGAVDCAHGRYPAFTVRNIGGGTLRWRFAFAGLDAVTTNPTSGALAAGQEQTVTFVGAYTPPASGPQVVSAGLDSNGGNWRVTFPCQSGG